MMNEKIEINTLITKHENKCKGCRFDMIDVEDPLWEYGYPLKRVLIDNQTGETYDEVGKLVGLLNELETKCHKLEGELEELSAFIIEQREENKQLKKSEKINMEYAEQIVEENQKLRIAKNDLRIENERLKSRNNYNLEDCLLEIVELKEEKEQLKKKLESLQKVLHLVECVSDE